MAAATTSAVGTLLGVVLSAYGMYRQEEENKAARQESRAMRAQDIARESQIRAQDLALMREQRQFERKELARQWKWKEEERDYVRGQNFVNRFMGVLDREPAFRNQLLQVWGRR